MRKSIGLWLVALVLWLSIVACAPDTGSGTARLAFQAPLNVDSGQRFHVSLGVRNLGEERFRDQDAFNGAMELRNVDGTEYGRIQVTTLWALAPGEAGWPAAYAAKLPAGAYQLVWGAPGYGSVTVEFTIVELEGRLYLGREAIQSTGAEAEADEREHGALQSLVDLARVNLARRLGVAVEAVTVPSVEEVEFPDASLGIPEPDQMYAQVLTPGYVMELAVEGQTYRYHASDQRLAFVPTEAAPPGGSLTTEEVRVAEGQQIEVSGRSTLPEGTCLNSELWADGEPQPWWPGETCIPVEGGAWHLAVPLGTGEAPAELDPAAQYVVRVFQRNGPNVVSVLAFDLEGPPTPGPQ